MPRRLAAEFLGTLLLLAAVVGSGIMGERLAGGNVAIALLANTIATGAALIAILLALGEVSGAHLNPAVTLVELSRGSMNWREALGYLAAQLSGAFAGVAAAHGMFGLAVYSVSAHVRSGPAQVFSEFVATFGLVAVILGCARQPPWRQCRMRLARISQRHTGSRRPRRLPTSAVTLARALTNTLRRIRPVDVLPFVAAQLAGAFAVAFFFRFSPA